MRVDPQLLSVIACPQDKGTLDYYPEHNVLVNPRLNLAYPVVDGIPVLLASDATPWEPHS